MKLIETRDQLEDWAAYREFMKIELKKLGKGTEPDPVFVTDKKLKFQIEGKPWSGHAVLAGKLGLQSARKLKKAGLIFREGTCELDGKNLALAGIVPKLVKESEKTFMKLRLGYKIAGGGEEGAEDADSDAGDAAELAEQAKKVARAVDVWKKTEEAATKELRKLQKALMALEDPRVKPVIQGLEGIRTRIDGIDDEAKAVANAARNGDASAFDSARQGFVRKMEQILAQVEGDELIRQADSNPVATVKIGETFRKSLTQLIQAV